ncbi:MAG TPA: glutamate-5-semialdehyde dehydrogenase, partial [Pirellulales bacterium]|nr:glutamate-5-semialdehyde dehydrogenase [Pirellulales bacterium]
MSLAVAPVDSLRDDCLETARRAKAASRAVALLPTERKNAWLRLAAERLRAEAAGVLAANELDLSAAPGFQLTPAEIDRLRLTNSSVQAIARGLDEVAALPDPVGEVLESTSRPNGLQIQKVRVPLGVVFFIYESRPNVTADAAAICVKSGNAVILRGGKEAAHSSRAIVEIIHAAAAELDLPRDAVQLVSTADRAAVSHFLGLPEYIDLAIPRGGEGLIRHVVAAAKMPVIKHYTGNCHVYIDASADLDMAERITVNAKCQRMGVCNAAESLLVHADIAPQFLPRIGAALSRQQIEIRGDAATRALVAGANVATEADYAAEYLGPIISVKV